MSRLKGSAEAARLMAQVRAHRKSDHGQPVAAKTPVGQKPGEAAHTAGGEYADPGYQADGLKRYPLDTPEHVRAAASYFGIRSNRDKYKVAQRKEIDSRIHAAEARLTKPVNEQDVALRFMRARSK